MPTSNTMKLKPSAQICICALVKVTLQQATATAITILISNSKIASFRSEAVADELCNYYRHNTIVDTILCLDGMEVVGTCLADRLTSGDYVNMNAHQTIYVVTPESVNSSQLLFRDNIVPMIQGKHVLVLAVSVATGRTVEAAVDAVKYYGGEVAGIASIFATSHECSGYTVNSVFDPNDLPDYKTIHLMIAQCAKRRKD